MLKELISLANHLDSKGFRKEADHLDSIVTKLASSREIMDNLNYINDPRSNARSGHKGYDPKEGTLTIEFTRYLEDDEMYKDDDGEWVEEVEEVLVLPAKEEVCDMCGGRGSYVDPVHDAGGLTQEDFDRDPGFREEYFSGSYDMTCEQCRGTKKVPVVDEKSLSKDLEAKYHAYLKAESDRIADEQADRRTRFMESGGYGW